MSVLIVAYSSDTTVSHLLDQAALLNVDFEMLDLLSLRDAQRLIIEQARDDLTIEMGERRIQFSKFTGFYNRCDNANFGEPLKNACLSRISAAVFSWMEFCGELVINRPSAGASNNNKYLHSAELRRYGFTTPDQVLLGCPSCAESVVAPDGTWVNKSCSG